MRKKIFGLKSATDVPLLEQEKIKELNFFNKKSRSKTLTIFGKSMITAISTLLVICLIVTAFLICDFEKDVGKDETDKQETGTESDIAEETGKTDLEAVAPSDTESEDTEELPSLNMTLDKLYEFDQTKVLEGEVGIIPMDLSQKQNGVFYINNSTGYLPNLEILLEKNFKNNNFELLTNKDAPRVLLLHTHASDSYVYDGKSSYKFDPQRDFARSDNSDKNVVSVGQIISNILNENGITTLHCTTLHDSIRYKDSYARSESTVKEYLERYPTIQLVIDVQRDSILSSSGDIIRPVTLVNNKPTAQVSCTVGSDWAGDSYENWQDNLSLALKLRELLNLKYSNLCMPVELSPYTFNQELSRYSMTIKIGSSGNSIDEARAAAELIGENLVEIIKIIPF